MADHDDQPSSLTNYQQGQVTDIADGGREEVGWLMVDV